MIENDCETLESSGSECDDSCQAFTRSSFWFDDSGPAIEADLVKNENDFLYSARASSEALGPNGLSFFIFNRL